LINTDFEVVRSFELKATQNLLDIRLPVVKSSEFCLLDVVPIGRGPEACQSVPNAKCQQRQGVPGGVNRLSSDLLSALDRYDLHV